ncbi:hypothetical protein BDR04DRAFT_1118635 [Suillus decipiens]|nr:hypothetical protein BDR04DRAFT_1118635 [Suillus decipiens]
MVASLAVFPALSKDGIERVALLSILCWYSSDNDEGTVQSIAGLSKILMNQALVGVSYLSGITINKQVPCMLLKNYMPCTSSTGSSVVSGSTGSFKSLSVSSQSPPTSEAPNSSPILRSSSSILKSSSSVSLPPTSKAPSSSPISKGCLKASLVTPNKHNSVLLPPALGLQPDSTLSIEDNMAQIIDNSSPIVKCHTSYSKADFPATPINARVSTVGSLAPMDTPMHKAPASFPVLRNNYLKPSSPPILRGSSPISKVLPLFTTMLDEGSPNMHNSHKRPHQYSLLLEDRPPDCENIPMKKPKLLLTTTFAAKMEYQHLRAEELELITSLIKDKMEESQAHVTWADLQIVSLQNSLHDAGIAVIGDKGRKDAKKVNRYSRVFPIHGHHEVDDSGDSCGSLVSSGCNGSANDDKLKASEQS